MIDFLIIYEVKLRDIENTCLIKYELERRGYKVDTICYFDYSLNRHKYLFRKKPKAVIMPFYKEEKCYFLYIKKIVGSVKKVANLQWEQLAPDALADANGAEEFVTHALVFSWGENNYNSRKKLGVKHPVIVGHTGMDFLREEFHNYYLSKEEIKKKYQLNTSKIVVYLSSFARNNCTEEYLLWANAYYKVDFRPIIHNGRISKRITLEWFETLLQQDKDLTIVYRPHPVEIADEVLHEMEKKYKNFRIIQDSSVKQWIKIADKVFTWMSTSVVEAHFAKANCYLLRPEPLPPEQDYELLQKVPFIDGYEAFEEAVYREEQGFTPLLDETLLSKYYDFAEKPTYQRVCDHLERMLSCDTWDLKQKTSHKYKLRYEIENWIAYQDVKKNKNMAKFIWFPFMSKDRIRAKKEELKSTIFNVASKEELNTIMNRIKNALEGNTP